MANSLFAAPLLAILAAASLAHEVKAQNAPSQQTDQSKFGADARFQALKQFLETLPKENRNDLRGFYIGMSKDAALNHADWLKLRTCDAQRQAQPPFREARTFTCKTHSELEVQKDLNFSEQYMLFFTEGLNVNMLGRIIFYFASTLPADELINILSKQYGVKPVGISNPSISIGQLGNIPMPQEATFQLADGSKLRLEPNYFYGKPFYKMEMRSDDFDRKEMSIRRTQDRHLSQPPKF